MEIKNFFLLNLQTSTETFLISKVVNHIETSVLINNEHFRPANGGKPCASEVVESDYFQARPCKEDLPLCETNARRHFCESKIT